MSAHSPMTLVPWTFSSHPLQWTVPGLLSASECRDLISRIEDADPRCERPDFRNQDRHMWASQPFSEMMFERLRPHLPPRMGELELVGLNEMLRLYRYREGQFFQSHRDHWYQPNARRISLLTLLVYLNEDFEGGQTLLARTSKSEALELEVLPRTGAALVFQHKVQHEGATVAKGVKYALRTDVMYAAAAPIQLTYTD